MVSMFTSSVGSSLGKINDYKIVICYFFTKNSALKSKNKDWLWLNNNKMNCELMLTYDTPALRQTGSRYDGSKNASHDMGYLSCNNGAKKKLQLKHKNSLFTLQTFHYNNY